MKHADCIQTCLSCAADCDHCLAMMAGKQSMNDCPACKRPHLHTASPTDLGLRQLVVR